MTGGIISLVAKNKINYYVEGNYDNCNNTTISLFKKVYIANTPFCKFTKTLTNLSILRDTSTTCKITLLSSEFDLLSGLKLQLEIIGKPDMKQFIRGFVMGLINKIELDIGGVSVEIIDAHIINIYNELYLKEAKRQYNDYLNGNNYIDGQQSFMLNLPFFFTKHISKSLPLCALKYHNVVFNFTFNSLQDIIKPNYQDELRLNNDINNKLTTFNKSNVNNTTLGVSDMSLLNGNAEENLYDTNFTFNISILGDCIVLGDIEKVLFNSNHLEYCVNFYDIQKHLITSTSNNIILIDNLICNEMQMVYNYVNNSNKNSKYMDNELFNYVNMNNCNFKLNVNGNDLAEEQKLVYNLINVNNKYHNNVPRTIKRIPIMSANRIAFLKLYNNVKTIEKDINSVMDFINIDEKQYIYSYVFGIEPENELQYTGGINMSKLDSFKSRITNVNNELEINYNSELYKLQISFYLKKNNIIKIKDGMFNFASSR